MAISGIFEKWKSDWIDPALGYTKTDSHLNDVSIEYPEHDVQIATNNFDPKCMLGCGTFGSVFKGTMRDGTEVAIKLLQVPEEAGFEDEVKVLSRFRHPNLVILMGFSRHMETGGRGLIYEYLAGGDVSKRLQRSRHNSEDFFWKNRLSAGLDAACGLSHLHNLPVRAFHRDIKGPNILLDKNGTAKMADFGLSCVSETARHTVLQASGTVGYACPEYIRTGVITEYSEVHSFGMVLFELLTGAPPAVQRPDRPSEFCYLVDHLQGSVSKVIQMLDPTANFPPLLSQRLAEVGFKCITIIQEERPLFKRLVEELRALLAEDWKHESVGTASAGRGGLGRSPRGGEPQVKARPQQPPQQLHQHAYPRAQLSPRAARQPQNLVVGQVVEARWRGGLGWFRGRIARENPNGTFGVRYDDNDFEEGVPPNFIRALELGLQAVAARQPSHGPSMGFQGSPASAAQPRQRQSVASGDCNPPLCRLWCVHAEGVELGKMSEQQRALPMAEQTTELIIGRTAQPTAFWNTLVPDLRLHGTVSREHAKIVWRAQGVESPGFYLNCMSLNGLLMNGDFMRQGGGDRRLQHGDVVAFAASTDLPTAGASPAPNAPRKRFIAFSFEIANASWHAEKAPTPVLAPTANSRPLDKLRTDDAQMMHKRAHDVQSAPLEDTLHYAEATQPPEGCSAGRWRSAEDGSQMPDALFCLEVHGNGVRTDLPSDDRQLVFSCQADAPAVPCLRVGRRYQQGLWQRIVSNPQALSGLSTDHFEVCPVRRKNPSTREPPDWRYRLRVLSSAGLMLNYGLACKSGEERELKPGNTLTITQSGGAVSSTGVPQGLHFTFIPLVGTVGKLSSSGPDTPAASSPSAGRQSPAASSPSAGRQYPPSRLPDFEDGYDGSGAPLIERSIGGFTRAGPQNQAVGALKPLFVAPTSMLDIAAGREASSPEHMRQASEVFNEGHPGQFEAPTGTGRNGKSFGASTGVAVPFVSTRIMAPPPEEEEPRPTARIFDDADEDENDLFSRSGFISRATVANATSAAMAGK